MNPHQPSQLLTNLGLAALAGFAALAGLFRLSGTITAFLTGHPQPAGGPATGLGVLFTLADPGQAIGAPDLNPFVYWAVLALMLALLGTLAWWVWRLIARAKETKAQDPRLLKGIATPREVEKVASAKTLVSRASTYRPSLEHPTAADVGYVLGRSKGREVWATVEDSILLIGPPRSGKGLHIVINAILDAPGAVITTSTRPDNLTATMRARQRVGPVAVFDPQHLAEGLPAGMKWSPVRGCEDPLTAMIRATGLATATNFAAVSGGDFWQGKTASAIQGAPPCRRPRRPRRRHPLPMGAQPHRRSGRGTDHAVQSGCSSGVGGVVGCDAASRPENTRLDLAGRLPRLQRVRRSPRPCCCHTGASRPVRPGDVHQGSRHLVSVGDGCGRWGVVGVGGGVHRRPRGDRAEDRRYLTRYQA